MRRKTDDAHIRGICKDGSHWCLPWDEGESFETAWLAGRAFWTGTSLWGERIVVKLGDNTGLVYKTTDGNALQEAEAHEHRHRDMLNGGSA